MRDTVATTILQQMGGAMRLKAMINARDFIADDYSLAFKFSGSKKAKMCRIVYDYIKDLYSITFFNSKAEVVDKTDGAHNDQLQTMFYNFTGLYLTL